MNGKNYCEHCGIEIKGMYDMGKTDICAKCYQIENASEYEAGIIETLWENMEKSTGDKHE